jgi:DNA-binding response OmpR family regulator
MVGQAREGAMERRVLVVDDEARIRAVLRAYLEADGFTVSEAATGQAALASLADPARTPSLVLLDVGLPDLDGLEVLRTLRQSSDVPVILVTARAEEVDKLVGLGVGADDYVTKPFSPREVVARARAVLRRAGGAVTPPDASVHSFDGLVIDEGRREVVVAGSHVAVSALEFDLLVALAGSPGRVYSRAQLLEKVWGYDFYGDERVVDVHIRSLRKLLGDDATTPRLIGTVRGVGYKFLPQAREEAP